MVNEQGYVLSEVVVGPAWGNLMLMII